MLLLLRTAALTGGATVGLTFGVTGAALTPGGVATVGIAGGLSGTGTTTAAATVDIAFGLTDIPPVTGAASLDLTLGLSGVAVNGTAVIAGPTDGRIADTAFRRKKKRRIQELEAPSEPVQIVVTDVSAPIETVTPKHDFRSLAELSGKSIEVFRAEVDREIAQLLRESQERDDEDAFALILAMVD